MRSGVFSAGALYFCAKFLLLGLTWRLRWRLSRCPKPRRNSAATLHYLARFRNRQYYVSSRCVIDDGFRGSLGDVSGTGTLVRGTLFHYVTRAVRIAPNCALEGGLSGIGQKGGNSAIGQPHSHHRRGRPSKHYATAAAHKMVGAPRG